MLIMTRLLVQTTCLSAARHWTMNCSRKTCHSKACPSTMTCRTSSCDAWQTSPDQNANRRGLLPATDRINADTKHADCRVQTSLAAALVRLLLLLLDASNHRLHVMRARAMKRHIDPTTGKPRLRSRPHGLRACRLSGGRSQARYWQSAGHNVCKQETRTTCQCTKKGSTLSAHLRLASWS